METILIATDLSSAARNATRYGFELSKSLNAKVILLTVYQHPSIHPESMVYLPATDLERTAYEQLAVEAETFDPQATVLLETQCHQGPVGEAIMSVAAKENVSFIVLGMKHTDIEYRKYFGSTVTMLSKHSSIPLIVVPQEAKFVSPKTIAYAYDLDNETDIHILDPLKKIALAFNSLVTVLRVVQKPLNEMLQKLQKSERQYWFLDRLNYSFLNLEGDNIAKTIHNFVKENAVNLVAVIPHQHDLIERIFTRSVTKDLIFRTHVPLLVLPHKLAKRQDEAKLNVYNSKYVESIF